MKAVIVLAFGLLIGMLGATSDNTQVVTPVWEMR
jgi:hypothetical protein